MWMGMIRAHGLIPSRLERVIDRFAQEDLPAIEAVPGFAGMAIAANHGAGSVLSLSFWESEEALAGAEEPYAQARERARTDFTPPDPYLVEDFEVTYSNAPGLVLDAERPYLRVVRFTGMTADDTDEATSSYREDSERQIGATRGLGGIAMGTNREAGRLAVVSYWTSERAMSEAAQASVRGRDQAAAVTCLMLTPLIDHFEITLTRELERVVAAVQPQPV